MFSKGHTTRLFQAIVGLGLAAASAGCMSPTSDDMPAVPADAQADANDAAVAKDADAGGAHDAPSDVVDEGWYPVPIV